MPLYEYECTACRRHTEKIQKFSDPEITTCPHCGGALKRVISAPAFTLKGGGWYSDLYSSAKPGSAATSGEGGSSGAESKPAGESTAKPASENASSTPAAAPASSSSTDSK